MKSTKWIRRRRNKHWRRAERALARMRIPPYYMRVAGVKYTEAVEIKLREYWLHEEFQRP
jgi:hypothetical protein